MGRKSVFTICVLLLAGLMLVALPLAGCGESGGEEADAGWVKTEIYCGRDIPSLFFRFPNHKWFGYTRVPAQPANARF